MPLLIPQYQLFPGNHLPLRCLFASMEIQNHHSGGIKIRIPGRPPLPDGLLRQEFLLIEEISASSRSWTAREQASDLIQETREIRRLPEQAGKRNGRRFFLPRPSLEWLLIPATLLGLLALWYSRAALWNGLTTLFLEELIIIQAAFTKFLSGQSAYISPRASRSFSSDMIFGYSLSNL